MPVGQASHQLVNDLDPIEAEHRTKTWHQFELEADELDRKAESEREVEHEMCEADWLASVQIDTRLCWIFARWFTPGRSPECTSRQSPPEHDPAKEEIVGLTRAEDGHLLVDTVSKTEYGSEQHWRYELTNQDKRLLVTQVFSVWDDEEFPCFE